MTEISKGNPEQLTFELPHDAAMGREDYLVSDSNSKALELIDSWPEWPSNVVVLVGPTGSGKTHLVEIWKANSNAKLVPVNELGTIELTSIAGDTPIAIDGAGDEELDQVGLFHLINTIVAVDAQMLITSRRLPVTWGITLPDLSSRLRLATLIEVEEPDDNLLRQVLFKLFVDRQLDVEMAVIDYLVLRVERSLRAAVEVVHAIDQFTLREKRRITRPVAARVLAMLTGESFDQDEESHEKIQAGAIKG